MPQLVLFLQNAWSIMEIDEWRREAWMRALRRCLTGRRLNLVLGEDWNHVHVDNTTKAVGVGSKSKLAPDPDHIAAVLKEHKPKAVVACGKQAEESVPALWGGKLLVLPHPACRIVTNALLFKARDLLATLDFERCALRQGRGEVIRENFNHTCDLRG